MALEVTGSNPATHPNKQKGLELFPKPFFLFDGKSPGAPGLMMFTRAARQGARQAPEGSPVASPVLFLLRISTHLDPFPTVLPAGTDGFLPARGRPFARCLP